MNANAQENSGQLNGLKWLLVAAVVGAAVWGNSYFAAEPLLYRVIGLLVMTAIGIAISLQTSQGAAFANLAKGTRTEIRKVVWPTRQETTQTTMIVVVFVVVCGLILWGMDTLLGWLASLLIG
jgi:preprotein translocase subunit SecE